MPAKLPVTQEETRLVANVSRLRANLAAASDNFQRLWIRDAARAVSFVAQERGFVDIAVAASELVARAERAVVKANPPERGGRGKRCEHDSHLSGGALRQMRMLHSRLSDTEFEERVADHERLKVPITRKSLRDGPESPSMTLRSGRDEWWTPPHIIKTARHALGEIDLDPRVATGPMRQCRPLGSSAGMSMAWNRPGADGCG